MSINVKKSHKNTSSKLPNARKDSINKSKYREIMLKLKSLGNNQTRLKMDRFGINIDDAYGISVKNLRILAREIGIDHALALQLWKSGVHEARELASMIDDPNLVDSRQMEEWAGDFNSWDICDECCANLFIKIPLAYNKAVKWSKCEEMFVKRAGFVLMANLAIHNKKSKKDEFIPFLKIINTNAAEQRNLVKKAINWALKEIEKRNKECC